MSAFDSSPADNPEPSKKSSDAGFPDVRTTESPAALAAAGDAAPVAESSGELRPLTDSPWFWIYLFATFGLVALFAMGPKYAERQSQLDRQLQGRQFAASREPGEAARDPYSIPEDKLHDLRWLGYPLAVALAVAWGRLWWQRVRSRREPPEPSPRDSS